MTWVPVTCTLPTVEQPLRVAEFDDHLAGGVDIVATARELVARETGYCSFFTFDLQPSAAVTVLQIQVPESHVAVLDAVQQRADAARSGLPS